MNPRVRAFRLAYDGRPYHGFQRQPDVSTVEDTLFEALRELGVCEDEPRDYSASGRTDAGVSALAQTVAFETPDWLSPAALNGELPGTIRAWASADVTDFHATYDARSREYTYHLYAPVTEVDDARVREAADRLVGDHDFHNLTPDDTGTERDLSIDVTRDGEYLVCVLSAGGFARQLVRRVVEVLREIGTGESGLDKVDRVLSSDPIDGPDGVPPAPAYPLVLTAVEYDVSFGIDPRAATSAHSVFERSRIEHATRSRVAETISERLGSPDSRTEKRGSDPVSRPSEDLPRE